MISVDLEMSGIYPAENGIWQIGAYDLESKKEFLDECRIDDEDKIEKGALIVTGKTEKELRDQNKQSQKELLEKFFKWVEDKKIKNMLCQNCLDYAFLIVKARKYGLKVSFHYRMFDLHSIAQLRYYQKNGKFSIDKDHSNMNLKSILEFCGLKDDRIQMEGGKVVQEGKPHNALEDAKLNAKCFKVLIGDKK